jgi:TRAP-type C4-dicarboxylate transport system permease large subunit
MLRVITMPKWNGSMGACVYVVAAVGGVSLPELFRSIWPFVATALLTLLVIIAVPAITTTLPRAFGF